MRIAGLHHLAIKARDPAALAAFYVDLLGLVEVERYDDEHGLRSVWLGVDETVLMFERAAAGSQGASSESAGLHLLAFAIAAADAPAWRCALAERGVQVTSESAYSLYFSDPEGNRAGLSAHPEPLLASPRLHPPPARP